MKRLFPVSGKTLVNKTLSTFQTAIRDFEAGISKLTTEINTDKETISVIREGIREKGELRFQAETALNNLRLMVGI